MASDDGYKGGWFTFRERIDKYFLQGEYPSSFSKSDKQALRKRAKFSLVKGAELYYTGRGENQNDVKLQLQVCHITVLFPNAYNARRQWMSGYCSASC